MFLLDERAAIGWPLTVSGSSVGLRGGSDLQPRRTGARYEDSTRRPTADAAKSCTCEASPSTAKTKDPGPEEEGQRRAVKAHVHSSSNLDECVIQDACTCRGREVLEHAGSIFFFGASPRRAGGPQARQLHLLGR